MTLSKHWCVKFYLALEVASKAGVHAVDSALTSQEVASRPAVIDALRGIETVKRCTKRFMGMNLAANLGPSVL